MNKKYKAVIFDLDGTLFDTSEGIFYSLDLTVDKMGLKKLDKEVKNKFIGPSLSDAFKDLFGMTPKEADETILVYRNIYKEEGALKNRIFDGIEDLLKMLSDVEIKIGIATNKREDFAVSIVENAKISNYFTAVCGADFHGQLSKRQIVKMCAEKLNEKPSNSLLVGDSEFDGLSAYENGIDFIGVTYGFGFKSRGDVNQYKNKASADSVKELFEIMKNII